MTNTIQSRRGTAAQWTSANPTLSVGESGFETDTGKFKIGNGSAPWSNLAYAGGVAPTTKTRYINPITAFFGGSDRSQVTGQTGSSTTTTATVSAGATVIPFASVTAVVADMWYVLKSGTATPQLVKVVSLAGNDVTVTPALTQGLANGETIWPLWTDRYHLTDGGYTAFWKAIANAQDAGGNDYFPAATTGRIVFLGNSWGVGGGDEFTTQFAARCPSATIELASVSGNRSQDLLDRFDTDVTGTPKFVVFNEPGVNDVINEVPLGEQGANLAELARKITALGAIPVYVGPPPLRGFINSSAATNAGLDAMSRHDPVGYFAGDYPVAETSTSPTWNTRLGALTNGGDRTSAGIQNVSVGHAVHNALTSGNLNVAVGYTSQQALTTGQHNVSVGGLSLTALTTGSFNTALGHLAQRNMTTATLNTGIGYQAQYNPNNVSANATTTGTHQTSVGAQTGQSSTTVVHDITTIGYRAIAGADRGTALGSTAKADHADAVALGSGTTTTATFQIQVGARHFEGTELAADPAAPAANAGRHYYRDNGAGKTQFVVRFATGAVQVLATEP